MKFSEVLELGLPQYIRIGSGMCFRLRNLCAQGKITNADYERASRQIMELLNGYAMLHHHLINSSAYYRKQYKKHGDDGVTKLRVRWFKRLIKRLKKEGR